MLGVNESASRLCNGVNLDGLAIGILGRKREIKHRSAANAKTFHLGWAAEVIEEQVLFSNPDTKHIHAVQGNRVAVTTACDI
jgi:hypothetical protein